MIFPNTLLIYNAEDICIYIRDFVGLQNPTKTLIRLDQISKQKEEKWVQQRLYYNGFRKKIVECLEVGSVERLFHADIFCEKDKAARQRASRTSSCPMILVIITKPFCLQPRTVCFALHVVCCVWVNSLGCSLKRHSRILFA